MDSAVAYVNKNIDNYIEELKDFLRIPSISTMVEHKNDVKKGAQFAADKLKKAGLSRVEIFQTEGHPIVYGEWLGAPGKPTVLIYGHYDVQPVDPIELWDSKPFDPVIKNGKIYARGATDDKGQLYAHIKSVEALFKTDGSLPLNVKFILEGEEEIGSVNLEPFIKNNKDLLKCDCVLVSDTSLYAKGQPTITYGLRGLCFMEIEVTGPKQDLHSGTYGGVVANPANTLAEIVTGLKDKNGKIRIPGFYEDVKRLTKAEKENMKSLKFSESSIKKETGVKELYGEPKYSALERIWARPTLDVNGMLSGFTGAGAKTIIPSKASAKISMRLVPNQEPKKIARLFKKYVKSIAPKTVKVDVREVHHGLSSLSPLDSKEMQAAAAAMGKAFGKKTVFMREGGSIPVVAVFSNLLKANTVLMGLGLNSENLHSPNEHFDLNHFKLGILSSLFFFEEYAGK